MTTLTVRVPGNTAWSEGHTSYADAMEQQRKAFQVTGISHKIYADATDSDIEALKIEAGEAGDASMVELCAAALNGDKQAWAACESVLADAMAQCDD